MKTKISFLLLFIIAIILGGFLFYKRNLPDKDQNKINVVVSILPQKQIVEMIGGDQVSVTVLIPPGFSPATYEPTVKEIQAVAVADVYFRIGQIPFEKTNLQSLIDVNPRMKVVDTSAKNHFRQIEEHDHGDEDEHEAEENGAALDPHVWLVPSMVEQQAEQILQTLQEISPDDAENFAQNFQHLQTQLDDLDLQLEATFAPIKGQKMLVYHPAFGYLADTYGFEQVHVEIEGKEPSIKDIEQIVNQARTNNIKVVFVQQQFSTVSAQAIAENIGGVVVQIDPLAPDYFANMRTMAETIASKLN